MASPLQHRNGSGNWFGSGEGSPTAATIRQGGPAAQHAMHGAAAAQHLSCGGGMTNSPRRRHDERRRHLTSGPAPPATLQSGSSPAVPPHHSPEAASAAALRQLVRPSTTVAPAAALARASPSDRRSGPAAAPPSSTSTAQQRRSTAATGGYGGSLPNRVAAPAASETSSTPRMPGSPPSYVDMLGSGAAFLDVGDPGLVQVPRDEFPPTREPPPTRLSMALAEAGIERDGAARLTRRRNAANLPATQRSMPLAPPVGGTPAGLLPNSLPMAPPHLGASGASQMSLAERIESHTHDLARSPFAGEEESFHTAEESSSDMDISSPEYSAAQGYPGLTWASGQSSRHHHPPLAPHVQHSAERSGRSGSGNGGAAAADQDRPNRTSQRPRPAAAQLGPRGQHAAAEASSPQSRPTSSPGGRSGPAPRQPPTHAPGILVFDEAVALSQMPRQPPAHAPGILVFDEAVALSQMRIPRRERVPSLERPEPSTAAAPAALDQREKDEHLGELLQYAAMHGLGDIDPEVGSDLLEEAGWDVTEAFALMCGGSGAAAAEAARAVRRANEERPLPRPRRADHALRDRAQDTTERQTQRYPRAYTQTTLHELDGLLGAGEEAGPPLLPPAGPHHLPMNHRRLLASVIAMSNSAGGEEEAGVFMPFGLGQADDDEEIMGMHAMLHMLMRSQDEADLQDAMRRSSEEAYSGGFSVPPVDEVLLQSVTATSEFCASDEKGQCSVCLMDFEYGDSLRSLECCHRFHMACVDQWLAQTAQCPVCKKQVGSGACGLIMVPRAPA